MISTPELFLTAIQQRGWTTALKMVAIAFRTDEIALYFWNSEKQAPTELHGWGLKRDSNGPSPSFIPLDAGRLDEFPGRCSNKQCSDETNFLSENREFCLKSGARTEVYAISFSGPHDKEKGGILLSGSWMEPFSETELQILREFQSDVRSRFPSYDERIGIDESNYYGCADMMQDNLRLQQLGIWIMELDNPDFLANRIYFSKPSREIKGIGSPITLGDYIQLVHPEDRESLLLLASNALASGEPTQASTYRLIVENEVRDLVLTVYPVRDRSGKIVRFFGLTQNVSRIKTLERSLNETNRRFGIAMEKAQLSFWTLTNDRTIHWARKFSGIRVLKAVLGGRESLSIDLFLEHVFPADRGKIHGALVDIAQGVSVHELGYRIMIGKTTRHFVSWIYPVLDANGDVVETFGLTQDVTRTKKLEQNLLDLNDLFSKAITLGQMGHWRLHLKSNLFEMSDMVRAMIGIDKATISFDEFADLFRAENRETVKKGRDDLAHGEETSYRITLQKKGGAVHLYFCGFPIHDNSGSVVAAFGLVQDITEQKKLEEELEKANTWLSNAMEIGQMGYWKVDWSKRLIAASTGLQKITGVNRPEFSLDKLFQITLPEDDQLVRESFESLLDGKENNVSFRINADGQIKHVFSCGFPIRDPDGKTTASFGILQDVTEQKIVETTLIDQEKQVREKEIRYRNLYENSNDAIHIVDHAVTLECNKRSLGVYGYETPDDFIGTTVLDLSAEVQPNGRRSDEMIREIFQQARDGNSIQFDWMSRRKNGTLFESTITLLPIHDETDQFQVVVHDVTEQKAAARTLENSRSYISLLAEIRKSFYSRTEQEIVQTFLETATQNFGLDKAWYGIRIGNTIRPVFHAGKAKGFIDMGRVDIKTLPIPNDFPLARAIREAKPIAVDFQDNDKRFESIREFLSKSRFRSSLAIPVDIQGKIEAGVVFYSLLPNAFDEAIVDYLHNSVKELSRISSEKRFWAQQQRTLKKAKENAEAAALAKTQFLANMSHEIRTPMTSILGYTEMLLKDHLAQIENSSEEPAVSPEFYQTVFQHCRSTAKVIQNNAEFLLSILNDILDFSKMEANKLIVECLDCPLQPFLVELASFYSIQARSKKLDFIVQSLTTLPKTMNTDPIRIKQILINLVGNAIKFTSYGKVSLSVAWVAENEEGDLSIENKDVWTPPSPNTPCKGKLFFSVRDSGIGIAPEHLSSLFTPFHQADSSTTRRFGGTGLGLAISKRLIQLLGGDLTVSSKIGEGSAFTVILPQQFPRGVAWTSQDEQFEWINGQVRGLPETFSSTKSIELLPKPLPLLGMRILLAEDGKDNQRLFSFILSKAGAQVQVADNGQIAFELTMENWRNKTPFDVILMDMQMPVMDGYTSTRLLRNEGYELPVIALTAHALMEERQKCLNAGCNDYATKPILRDALIASILNNVGPKNMPK